MCCGSTMKSKTERVSTVFSNLMRTQSDVIKNRAVFPDKRRRRRVSILTTERPFQGERPTLNAVGG